MSTFYLINTTTVGSQKYMAGRLMNDAIDPTAAIIAAGGVLITTANAAVAVAAAVAAKAARAGADENTLNAIMGAGIDAGYPGVPGTNQGEMQRITVLIPLATIQAQTSGAAFNVGSPLPANARLVDYNMNVLTPVTGGSISAVTATLQGGTDAAGSLIASHSVFTGANPLNSPVGSNPYPTRGGQQLKATLTSTGGALSTATAGSLSIDLFYTVIP